MIFVHSTQTGDSPYLEAITRAQDRHGDVDGDVDVQSLSVDVGILNLLRQGRATGTTRWTADTDDVPKFQRQLICIDRMSRALAAASVANIRQDKLLAAIDCLLDAIALGRNATRGVPFRMVKAVELSSTQHQLRRWAAILPSLPHEDQGQTFQRLASLPMPIPICTVLQTNANFLQSSLESARIRCRDWMKDWSCSHASAYRPQLP